MFHHSKRLKGGLLPKSPKKKKKMSCDDVVPEVRTVGFARLKDDPNAWLEAMSNIKMRFKIEPSSASIKEKVAQISSACFNHCLRLASKF